MSTTCTRCPLLEKQCIELKNDLASLQQQVDNLRAHVFQETVVATQVNQNLSICSETEDNQTLLRYPDSQTVDENSNNSDILFDIFVEAEKNFSISPTAVSTAVELFNNFKNNVNNIQSNPYLFIPDHPFAQFNVDKLDTETEFVQQYHNRQTCFYGDIPYSYGRRTHTPHPFPHSENYIHVILEHLHSILPNFVYNSVLITK